MEQENYNNINENNIPEEYRPLSVGKFLGYSLLFGIPCVGFILLIVFACKGINNKNLINWARAQLIFMGIIVIVYVICFALGMGTAIFEAASSSMY